MGMPFIIGASQQKRHISDLGFEALIAPDDFDREAQTLDIYEIFNSYYKTNVNAGFIWAIRDAQVTTLLKDATSYRWGYTVGGVDYVEFISQTKTKYTLPLASRTRVDVYSVNGFPSSGTITVMYQTPDLNYYYFNFVYTSLDTTPGSNAFVGTSQTYRCDSGKDCFISTGTYTITWPVGSTKRWLILNNTNTDYSIIAPQNSGFGGFNGEWVYYGPNITVMDGGYLHFTYCKYVHFNSINQITVLGNSCFRLWDNGMLTGTVTFPGSLKVVPSYYTFGYSGKLPFITKIVVQEGVEELGNTPQISGYPLFAGCPNIAGSIVLPDSLKVLGDNVFSDRTKITSVTFGNSLEKIGVGALNGCTGITDTTLTLPSSLQSIGYLAFSGITSYTGSLTIPSSVTTIGYGAFASNNFNAISNSASNFDVTKTGGDTDVLYDITGGSKVEAIYSARDVSGSLIFRTDTTKILSYCSYLNSKKTGSLTIPNSVTTIGDYAFMTCSGITGSLTISNTLQTIGIQSFDGDGFTGTLTLPATLTSLGIAVFRNCKFTTLDMSSVVSLTLIPYASFSGCTSLTGTLTIPNSVTTIGGSNTYSPNGAFYNCNFTGLTLGSGLVTIEGHAFNSNNYMVGDLTIPNSVTTINIAAFYDTGFNGVLSVGSGLTTMVSENQFYNTNFSSITSSSTNYPAEDNVLYDVKTSGQVQAIISAKGYSGTLTLKTGTTKILANCFYNNTNRSGTLTLLSTITNINTNGFDRCSGFTRCDSYPATAPTVAANGLTLGGTARALHIPTGGGTGYGVAPWTTATIFTQPPVADL